MGPSTTFIGVIKNKSIFYLFNWASLVFGDDSHDVLNVLLASQEDWTSLVELLGNQIQDWFLSVSGQTSRLLHDVAHRHTLVEHPELSIGSLSRGRVHEDPAVLESPV